MKRIIGILISLAAAALVFSSCNERKTSLQNAILSSFSFCGSPANVGTTPTLCSVDGVYMDFEFTKTLDESLFDASNVLVSGCSKDLFKFSVTGEESKCLHVESVSSLPAFSRITIRISAGVNLGVNLLDDIFFSFTTEYDPSDKFERLSADELFEKVQKAAFLYFWDYAHPVSGLSRERYGSGETVTSGGSGFGLMTVPVAIERGWISRTEGLAHCLKVLDFLNDYSERFHGAWPHWLNGSTGNAIAFSDDDNGGDLVETAFLVQGLLTLRQYFTLDNADETRLRALVTSLWEGVEWSWYRNGGNKLYWHWSPTVEWKMNMPISGWNEALITYVLAAASPTYPIGKDVYDEGWAGNGSIRNGNKYFDVLLPLGQSFGGPMFYAHYSFLGLDPRHLKDAYADYWEQNVAHATINWSYCCKNSKGFGYGPSCWGLTASDYSKGYTASSPTADHGTIAPTAALASYPYLPQQAADAMEYFYYVLGDRLWGDYGFRDAFSLSDKWFAESYIAIDEGPIVVMLENARTGLLWDCFMADSDVQSGLDKLGFTWK